MDAGISHRRTSPKSGRTAVNHCPLNHLLRGLAIYFSCQCVSSTRNQTLKKELRSFDLWLADHGEHCAQCAHDYARICAELGSELDCPANLTH